MPAGCAATFASPTWTVTCASGGTYTFGALSMSGGITVNFNMNGSASTTYNFSGPITNSGTSLKFGPGTFNLYQGLYTSGGSTTIFGAGTFYIGRETSACPDGGYYSICNEETGSGLAFDGPSTFILTAGIYNGGGDDITFGAGSTTNSYAIGKSSNGYALNVGGGSTTTFDGATGTNFRMVGNLTESGGSCVTLPAATNHDINGNVTASGGLMLGPGLYAVAGSFLIGASGGGDVSCVNADDPNNSTTAELSACSASMSRSPSRVRARRRARTSLSWAAGSAT